VVEEGGRESAVERHACRQRAFVDHHGGVVQRRPRRRVRAWGRDAFTRICTHVAAAHDCTAEVAIDPGYPPTVNDARAVALVRAIAGEVFVEPAASNMGGEDFSYVLEKIPGAMAFLGVAAPGSDAATRAPLHNPAMMIDESALTAGVALHCAFATRFLEHGWA
jgi:hippurate hydrolase